MLARGFYNEYKKDKMTAKKLITRKIETIEVAQELMSLPAFRHMPIDLLHHIASYVEKKTLEKNKYLFKKGQQNNILHLLMDGHVDVYVDNERIGTITERGSVIGEMSVVTHEPISADIKTKTDIEYYTVAIHNITGLSEEDSLTLQHGLYRIFSFTLAQRLKITNNKARNFEVANRKLIEAQKKLIDSNHVLEEKVKERTKNLEQQNIAMLASLEKLEEVMASQTNTFKKLTNFNKHGLNKLFKVFSDLVKESETSEFPVNKSELIEAQTELHSLHLFLSSLTKAYDSEKALKSKKILILENTRKNQIIAQMALGGMGLKIDLASEKNQAKTLIDSNKYDLILSGPELIELLSYAKNKDDQTRMIFMTSENIVDYIHYLKLYPFISNVIARNDEDRITTIKNISTTVNKMINQDVFGLEKYLSWGVEVNQATIHGSHERRKLIDKLCNYFNGLKIKKSITKKICTVTEELLMNAIYDAPKDKDGTPLYNSLGRSSTVNLSPEHQGKLRFACDGVLAAVSVEDPFGGLTKNVVFKYLSHYCWNKKDLIQQGSKGGAGIGLYMMITTADLIIFNVCKNQKTEVIALFNIDPKTSRQIKRPSFHFFDVSD